ncbi:MAG: hypothetical protein J5569_00745 [Oscillospiraceae bacterium]|nr:hypothetical protein [Oscillospiraceae bacterium]
MSDNLEKLVCSSCGSPLDIKPGLWKTVCPCCGTVYRVSIPEALKIGGAKLNPNDIPADIEIVAMDYKEMSLANTLYSDRPHLYSQYVSDREHYMPTEWNFGSGYGWKPKSFAAIDQNDGRFRVLDDELQIRYALSYLLGESYELSLDFGFSEDNVIIYELFDPNSIKKGRLFTSAETLREREKLKAQREASEILDRKVSEVAKWLDLSEPVLTGKGEVYNKWTITQRVDPEFAEAHLHKDFLETIKRVSGNPVLDQIAGEMARYLNLGDGKNIRVDVTGVQIGEWEVYRDGDIGWSTCKYNPSRGIVWKSAGGGSVEQVGDRLEWKFKAYSMDDIKDPHTRMAVLTALMPKIFALTVEDGEPRYVVRDVFLRTICLGRTKRYVKKYNQW